MKVYRTSMNVPMSDEGLILRLTLTRRRLIALSNEQTLNVAQKLWIRDMEPQSLTTTLQIML